MRAWCRFRVILHGKYRKCFVAKAFHRSVVQIEVGNLQIRCSGYPIGGSLDSESVILGRDQNPSR